MATTTTALCPSAQADSPGAAVFALVAGAADAPRAAYLDQAQPVDAAWRALAAPLAPGEVLRMAAPCARTGCGHFDGGADRCRLVDAAVQRLGVVVHKLPRCAIRTGCVWWRQHGAAACLRCPQVVTVDHAPGSALRQDPGVRAASAAAAGTRTGAAAGADQIHAGDVRFAPPAASEPR